MSAPAPSPPRPAPFGPRLIVGLCGVLLATIMSGLNNRVGALALADLRGALGFGADEGAWLNSAYLAGELVAMPFSCWLAITFSLRRFHLAMVAAFALLAALLPAIHSLPLLLALRAAQGLIGGMLIPVLMMAALRFLPLSVRLHGLALYALTATFSPNLAAWLGGQWTDVWRHWPLVYWQSLPLALLSMAMVAWGLPQDPVLLPRLRQANWFGMGCACVGLSMLALALDRGGRLDWWRSDLICWLALGGAGMTALFLLSEWFHPAPFIKLQLLGKRNLALGFSAFVVLLVVMLSGSLLPAIHLERVWGYRSQQSAPIGLIIAVPQLLLGSLVALLLYRRRVDARHVFALGLGLIALACLFASRITSDWTWTYFLLAQALQAVGQPMAVISTLFLCTSVVLPPEGPYVAGTVNTLRAFGILLGSAVVSHFVTLRERFHNTDLTDRLGQVAGVVQLPDGLGAGVRQQAFVLAISDAYWLLGTIALLLILPVLCLQYVPPPGSAPPAAPQTP